MTLKLLKCLFTEPFLVISGLSGPQIWLGNDNSLHFFFSGGDYDCKIEEVDFAKFDLIARWWYIICAMFVCAWDVDCIEVIDFEYIGALHFDIRHC